MADGNSSGNRSVDTGNPGYPEPVVGIFLRDDSEKILLVRSPKWENGNIWTVPGGHVEYGETIADAAKRETREEIGLDVRFERVFEVMDAVFLPSFIGKRHFIFLECACSVDGEPTPVIDGREISEARWFDVTELGRLKIQTEAREAIGKLLAAD